MQHSMPRSKKIDGIKAKSVEDALKYMALHKGSSFTQEDFLKLINKLEDYYNGKQNNHPG
jgi:HD-GYP domain-containing protein (c-di-GMP phosphodiesterase class II)